jgi:hypothetical protein
MNNPSADYTQLLDQFLNHNISVEQFQTVYLNRFKNETRWLGGELFELLEELFGDIDAFSTDPQLLAAKPDFYLNEQQLRERVQQAAKRLLDLSA